MTTRQLAAAALVHAVRSSLGVQRPHVLLACMPKSASTFLSRAMSELPGMRRVWISVGGRRAEQELDATKLARFDLNGWVAQQHVCFSDGTAERMKRFRVTPFVMTRNLLDCIASLRDHFRKEGTAKSMAWLEPVHAKQDDDALESTIADLVMPWYVRFFVSWKQCPDATWIEYERVRSDPEAVIRLICERAGIQAGDEAIRRALARTSEVAPRLNKGASGRGAEISQYAKDRVARLPG